MRAWAGLAVFAIACAPPAKQTTPELPRRTTVKLPISQFRVSNGLQVVLVPDASATDVQVTMRYRVGAIDDPQGQEGMAHLVEHLMFQLVANHESVFARLEQATSYFNGYTTLDVTGFVERAPADHLQELLEVELSRLQVPCATIGQDTFERERAVVIDELALHGAAATVQAALATALYPDSHAYHRNSSGDATTLGSITRDQACEFAAQHYGMKNAVLVVSGKVAEDELTRLLQAMLPRLPSRDVEPQRLVEPVEFHGERTKQALPIEGRAVMVAWPLPSAPTERAVVLAMSSLLRDAVDRRMRGSVAVMETGGDRAPLVAIVVELADGDTLETALAAIAKGRWAVRSALGPIDFERQRQRATHALFSRFEDGGARDIELARHVEAGRDAGQTYAAEIAAIANIGYAEAREIAETQLELDRASIIELVPAPAATARVKLAALGKPIHEAGQPRIDADAADAARPAASIDDTDPLRRIETTRLDNGMKLVLLPMSSVPAVEIRLVFAAGTADEPMTQRGLAHLAAYSMDLGLSYEDIVWALPFYQAGGDLRIDVQADHTSFATSGLDMYLDYLLTGIARWVVHDHYDQLDDVLHAMRRHVIKLAGAELLDAWAAAIYGKDHPYTRGGLHLDLPAIDGAAVSRFRDDHFAPDDATLVIAGGFDPDKVRPLARALFEGWQGHSIVRPVQRATVQPASIARATTSSQVAIDVVLPADPDPAARAAQLVIAQMMSELSADVRHQLGAAYWTSAELAEARLAIHYELAGVVDAARGVEAITLIRDRLRGLAAGGDALAGLFVRARQRVLARLRAFTTGSESLAQLAEHAIDLDRDIHADFAEAAAVRTLVLADIQPALAKLDLARAAILLGGPRDTVEQMYAVLGRTPTFIEDKPDPVPAETNEAAGVDIEEHAVQWARPAPALTVTLAPSYVLASTAEVGLDGWGLAADIGYRVDDHTAVGVHVSAAEVTGSYTAGILPSDYHQVSALPLELAAFARATAYDRAWGAAAMGLHLERVTDSGDTAWFGGLGISLYGGLDLVTTGLHRFGAYASLEGALGTIGFSCAMLGLAYRR